MSAKTLRHWIKVRLQPTAEAAHAAQIIDYWRTLRTAAPNITKAIRLYYALTLGDTSLLREYFPLLGVQRPDTERQPIAPASPSGKPKTREVQKSAEDDMSDFMESLGL